MNKKFLYSLLAGAMLAGTNCFASKIIYNSGVTGKTAAFSFPSSCVGHKATIWSIGFKRGENITVTLVFKNPSGEELANATSHYNNDYSNNSKTEQAILNFTFTVASGAYTLTLEGKSESENISQISNILVICWDCSGDDVSAVRTELSGQINSLRAELQGLINTKTKALEDRITALQNQLNKAVSDAGTNQASMLEEIQNLKNEVRSIEAQLQYDMARLERQQSQYLAELQSLKTTHQNDVSMLNLKISNLDSKYAAEVANIKADIASIESDLSILDAKFLATDENLKAQINALGNTQTALQAQLNSAEQKHTADVSAIQAQIDAKTELIRVEHSADVNRIEDAISNVDAKYETEVSKLNSELTKTNNQLTQTIRDYTAGDSQLQANIDRLSNQHTALDNELSALATEHQRDIADVRSKIEAANSNLKNQHDADVRLLNQTISDLNDRYETSVASLNSALNKTNADLVQAVRDANSSDEALLSRIETLTDQQNTQKNNLALLETEHNRDVAALRSEAEAKYELLQTRHDADIDQLTKQMNNLNSTYAEKVAVINAALESVSGEMSQIVRDYMSADNSVIQGYTEADGKLQQNIDRLANQQTALNSELASLTATHNQEVSELNNKIDSANRTLELQHDADVRLLNQQIATLDDRYQTAVSNLNADLNRTNSALAEAIQNSDASDETQNARIETLTAQQTEQRNALALLETEHNRDVAALRSEAEAKFELLQTQHNADIDQMTKQMNNLNSTYAEKVAAINASLESVFGVMRQIVRDYTNADNAVIQGYTEADRQLQQNIDRLAAQQTALNSELASLSATHDQEVAELNNKIDSVNRTLELQHEADVKLLNQQIASLDERYQTAVSNLNKELNKTNSALAEAIQQSDASDAALNARIETLTAQQTAQRNALTLLETEHNRDIAALRSEAEAKYQLLQTQHASDVNLLTQKINDLNATYMEKSAMLSSRLDGLSSDMVQMARDYTNGDNELREQIESLRLQQLNQQNTLTNLQQTHSKDIAALQKDLSTAQAALQEKIDTGIASLRQEMLALDTKYKDSVADLKSQLADVNSKLDREIAKLSDTDRDLYNRISDLREKQADYYARMEVLKVTHEKDKEALEKEIADLDAKYHEETSAINSQISQINDEISRLEAKHDADVEELNSKIREHVDKLDEDIRKIYLELEEAEDELAAYKISVQMSLDNLQIQLTELDKTVSERLRNLENRIKYSVYSDEKLEALQKDFIKRIQDKEKEIADNDLEISEMEAKNLDTSSKKETRELLLKDLVALRNELTDIEFAIEIRHNESEFAEHEKEIVLLKSALAELRTSSELQIKMLKDELAATELKYLALLEEAKQTAAAETEFVRNQLNELSLKVTEFVAALRGEREAGDTELKAMIDSMDVSHKELIVNLEKNIADQLERMKFESDTQFENIRSTVNNIAYQQRFSTGNSAPSYSLPNVQTQDVPADVRDLRVSPDAALDSILN